MFSCRGWLPCHPVFFVENVMRETMAGLPYKKHQALARESVRGSCKVSKNGCLNETISAEDELPVRLGSIALKGSVQPHCWSKRMLAAGDEYCSLRSQHHDPRPTNKNLYYKCMRVAIISKEAKSCRIESRVWVLYHPFSSLRTPVIRNRKPWNNNKGVWQSALKSCSCNVS